MPAIDGQPLAANNSASDGALHFPPVTREHILHCSYDYWFPKYRSSCIKSKIIPLSPDFVDYLREDRIILADDDEADAGSEDDDWEPTVASSRPANHGAAEDAGASDSDDESQPAPQQPPNQRFPALHKSITDAILALGGAVAPKLNWSAPKDAAWISPHQNTMKCTSPNDVYLLLKSSSFVSHDLEHAFDGCAQPGGASTPEFKPVLVLRAFFSPLPSLEFRCFVKDRTLIGITQRDLNYYAFLGALRPAIAVRVKELFNKKLRFTFPEGTFVFDVYIPESDYGDDDENAGGRLGRARLIDINPWAPRTDSLLFDWRELLDLRVPRPVLGAAAEAAGSDSNLTTDEDEDDADYEPEVRLVEKDDPAAYNFSSPQYSAHKLPKEVVDAGLSGEGGVREFAERWQRIVERGDDQD